MVQVGDGADRVKTGVGSVTIRMTVVLACIPPPAWPRTVIVYEPTETVDVTLTDIVEEVEPAGMPFEVKEMVTPVGWPEELSAMPPVNPPDRTALIVVEPAMPAGTATKVGEAEIVKDWALATP